LEFAALYFRQREFNAEMYCAVIQVRAEFQALAFPALLFQVNAKLCARAALCRRGTFFLFKKSMQNSVSYKDDLRCLARENICRRLWAAEKKNFSA